MNRRPALVALCWASLAFPATREAGARPSAKTPVIGLLDAGARLEWWVAFQEQLQGFGYVEGQNISASEYVEAGGLLSYGPSYADLFRRAAVFVDRILKGSKPGDLPFEQPTKFELVLNLKTARTLDVTIPRAILLRADRTIE